MKAPRNIMKSIRISKDLYEEIEKSHGDSWNDKLNNLLEFYITQHQDYLKYLKDLESQIQEKQQLLNEFKNQISKFKNLFN